jgi:hypothetical protein
MKRGTLRPEAFAMTDTPAPSRLRRLSVTALIVAVLVQLAVVVSVATADSAAAAPCENCGGGGGGGGGTTQWHSVTTMTPPAIGAINVVKGTALIQSCTAGSSAGCTIDDSIVAVDRPTSGWPTYSYAYAGPPGYSVSWTGRCVGTGVCTLPNDQETSSVVAHSADTQPPTVSISAPSRVTPSTSIVASASDNVGISSYLWSVCNGDGSGCANFVYGSTVPSVHLQGVAAGDHVVKVLVNDVSSNQTTATAHVTLVNSITMTSSTLPALTEAPSFTFESDDEAHIATRRCRAYPQGGTASDWGTCTTATSYAPTLADGDWTLQAEEVDDVGLSVDVTKQTAVDTTAPALVLTEGPSEGGAVTTTTVHFGFTATDAHLATVTCSRDGGAAVPCASPDDLAGYANGQHSLMVAATDQLGHVTSVLRNFSVAVPTKLSASAVTVTYGHAATLSSKITPASTIGTVWFATSTGATLCMAVIHAGVATCQTSTKLGGGARTVTATYAGNYTASTAHLTLTVRKAATSVRAKLSAGTVLHGKHVTITATHLPSTATGWVAISRRGHKMCSAKVSHGAAHCTATAPAATGTYTVTARYGGSANYAASSATMRLKVIR